MSIWFDEATRKADEAEASAKELAALEARRLISKKVEDDYKDWKTPAETARDIAKDPKLARAKALVDAKSYDDYINWR